MAVAAVKIAIPPDLEENLKDVVWRLNHLYKIVDKDGKIIQFKPNGPQNELLQNLHYKNLILKARQLGFSTFVQILMLDQCLWVPGVNVGMVAHRLPDATRIFRDKAQFAYHHLDDWIKARIPLVRRSGTEMVFANGSKFVVGVSLRSGTYQILHISEHGKICAQWPEKAKEVKTGALPTVPADGYIFIESTAEGQSGDFFEFCEQARTDQRQGVKLTKEHYRFHFYPWYLADEYRMDPIEAKNVIFPEKFHRYFEHLEKNHGIKLTNSQKAWYVLKAKTQHEDMKREMPSTADEAFEAIVENAIYGAQIETTIDDQRIGRFPPLPGLPCYTFWDIGISDHTAIWIVQFLPRNVRRHIGFYSGHNLATPHYTNWLQTFATKTGVTYTGHIMPHDGKNRDKLTGESYERGVERLTGIKTRSVERRDTNLGIYEIRNLWPFFEFDEGGCADGLRCLKAYQWDVDDNTGMAKKEPKHNWASHGCLAAGTIVRTSRGDVPIEYVRLGDQVWTPGGYGYVSASMQTNDNAEVVKVDHSSGSVTCTPNHPFLTHRGLVSAEDLCDTDVLINGKGILWNSAHFMSRAISFFTRATSSGFRQAATSAAKNAPQRPGKTRRLTSIGKYTRTWLAQSLMGITFTMSTKIKGTFTQTTWSPFLLASTLANTQSALDGLGSSGTQATCAASVLPSGTDQMKASSGTDGTAKRHGKTERRRRWFAGFADLITSLTFRLARSGARSHAKVLRVTPLITRMPVYDLTVEKHHCFSADGIMVSNSDALRSSAFFRPHIFNQGDQTEGV